MSESLRQIDADDVVRIRQSTLIGLHHDAQSLPLKSKKVASRLSGNYMSAFKGRGMEFDESRPYQPGDDIRSMDWKVTARTGKAHTKVFREERERPVLLWVDYQSSMFFGTRQSFKSVLAAKAAALLAWSTAQHGDRLGGLIFSGHHHEELRPQRGKAATLHFIKKLAEHPAWNQQQTTQTSTESTTTALNRLRRVARPGSLIFLISDFRHLDDQAQSLLSQLARHNDVVMLFIHDPLEARLPPAGYYRISDGTNEIGINTRDQKLCDSYHQRFTHHEAYLQSLSRKLGIYMLPLCTDQPLLANLQKGLGMRR